MLIKLWCWVIGHKRVVEHERVEVIQVTCPRCETSLF